MDSAQQSARLGLRVSEARGAGAWKPVPGHLTWCQMGIVGRGHASGGRRRETWGTRHLLTKGWGVRGPTHTPLSVLTTEMISSTLTS